jgi:hypothetical protein
MYMMYKECVNYLLQFLPAQPVTRQRQYGVYAEEALTIYATFGLGVITNIANG